MSNRWITAILAVLFTAFVTGGLVSLILDAHAHTPLFSFLVWLAVLTFFVVAAAAGVIAYLSRRNAVDWKRVSAEQRLWESGALGRTWLKRRKKTADRKNW